MTSPTNPAPATLDADAKPAPLVIMMPVYDEWESLPLVLAQVDAALASARLEAQIVVIDDASTDAPPAHVGLDDAKSITTTWLVRLSRNLGHQRAIAIGLAWIHANLPCSAVVVMDGDGEDDPRDIPRLVQACREQHDRKVVFAARARRSEVVSFRLAYLLYRIGHRLLVGRGIRFGNFSIVPKSVLDRLVSVSELWNHYAAAVLKAKLPYAEIPTSRAKRVMGASKMRVVALVTHGLSAISVSGETVGSRLLITASALVGVTVIAMIAVVVMHLTEIIVLPGWTTFMLALLFIIMVQAIMAALMFAFVTLSARNSLGFLPSRDHAHYIMAVDRTPLRTTARGGTTRA